MDEYISVRSHCGASQILLPGRCLGKEVDAGKHDGDVTSYLHPCWPNLPRVRCVISLRWSCRSLLLLRDTPNPTHRKARSGPRFSLSSELLETLFCGIFFRRGQSPKLLSNFLYLQLIVILLMCISLLSLKDCKRNSINCWLT